MGDIGKDHDVVTLTLAGETVPDVHTLAVLESALDTELWPRWPDRSAR